MLTSEVEVPRELLGWTVHKARWRGSVRWHPVWDVPRVPRRLPESDLEPPAQLMRGAGGPMFSSQSDAPPRIGESARHCRTSHAPHAHSTHGLSLTTG